jgi:hypothetical protein
MATKGRNAYPGREVGNALHGSLSSRATRTGGPSQIQTKEFVLTIVWIIVVIILVLLAIALVRRVL